MPATRVLAAVRSANGRRAHVLSVLAGVLALAAAALAALFTGESSSTQGLNGFVEGLSSKSSSFLGSVDVLAPLGIAFGAGMVAAVNPCGFALLPAYLGLYLGSQGTGATRSSPGQGLAQALPQALLVGGVVTLGFILLFGAAGLAIRGGAQVLVDVIPWLGLAVGVVLAGAGSWLLGGGKLYTGLAARAASHIGQPDDVGIKGYFFFGLSYGMASLSCTLPIFLVVVVTAEAVSGLLTALAQFLLYALGMGLVITALTVGIALFRGTLVGAMRKAVPYLQPVGPLMMIVAGSYIVYYWLTLGDLGPSIRDVF